MFDCALIDGAVVASDALDDRAFQYGDGLFETIAVVDGEPCLWHAHMQRLFTGCSRLGLPQPDQRLLLEECRRLAADTRYAALKLYWTAGDSPRGYRRPAAVRPRRILRLTSWEPAAGETGWRVRLCRYRLGDNPVLAGIKHLNRLDQVLGRAEWSNGRVDEGLMMSQDGRLMCGTISNLFLQFGEKLVTPRLDTAGVDGVVRGLVLQQATHSRTPVVIRDVAPDDAERADAMYLTSSLAGVVRVNRFESIGYDLGRAEHSLMSATRACCHVADDER
ncbi:MAG: aminodeoxychorismate lyase [Gammaproteobacteria bacterium]|nr:aminodeoxychorismate lyase [Gammaproteobacteria bacterium]